MTTYHVRYRLHSTQTVHERQFNSMLERALLIIGLSSFADILKEWEA